MSDQEIEDLQSRLAHQELAIERLSDTVARQDRLIAALREDVRELAQRLRELKPSPLDGGATVEPPPPHY